ncbi:hypothetical protein ACFX1Q_000012 [Malus domestica]
MLVSVRLSVVRKGPRSALACLSASSCGGGEEACPLFDGQEGFENKVLPNPRCMSKASSCGVDEASRLRASASNCRLVPRFIDASRFVLRARWVSVLATYCEGMLPLVVPFLLLLALPAGGRHRGGARVPDEPHSLRCSFGARVSGRHLGCGTLKGRWVFTASDRPIEALSLDAYDCRARREPSTVKVVGLVRRRRRRGMLPG